MTRWLVALILVLIVGMFIGSQAPWFAAYQASEMESVRSNDKVLYWVAPMDPNFRRDQPGKSPMGMDLVPVYAGRASAGEVIRITSEVEQNLGVRSELVKRGPLWRRMQASGQVEVNQTAVSHVTVRTAGWVERLLVGSDGELVSRGQVLFELYAPELISAQREFLSVSKRGNQSLVDAARENLMALGMTAADVTRLERDKRPSRRISVIAPHAGVVMNLNLAEGMRVEPSGMVMSLVDLSNVWVIAQHYQQHSAWLDVGLPAELRLAALPGQVMNGTVDYVYPELEPTSQTISSRILLANPDLQLKPGMLADVVVFGGRQADVLSIPSEALIRSGRSDRVVLALGDGGFVVQEVQVGVTSGDWIEVKRGLKEGDRIVTSAQFLLDSEASINGSVRRLSADDSSAEYSSTAGPAQSSAQ